MTTQWPICTARDQRKHSPCSGRCCLMAASLGMAYFLASRSACPLQAINPQTDTTAPHLRGLLLGGRRSCIRPIIIRILLWFGSAAITDGSYSAPTTNASAIIFIPSEQLLRATTRIPGNVAFPTSELVRKADRSSQVQRTTKNSEQRGTRLLPRPRGPGRRA